VPVGLAMSADLSSRTCIWAVLALCRAKAPRGPGVPLMVEVQFRVQLTWAVIVQAPAPLVRSGVDFQW